MATLRQYYETDFSNAIRMHVILDVDGDPVDSIVLYDFTGLMAYIACFIPGEKIDFIYFKKILKSLEYGRTQLKLNGKITLPSAKSFHGQLSLGGAPEFNVLARFHGDPTWVSKDMVNASKRVFLYTETNMTLDQMNELKSFAEKYGHDVQIRGPEYMRIRTEQEKPLAFISHDSRDKDSVARTIAVNLQKMLCPVWYDEFALNVGDNLRESIEKGLKECRKCILVLSQNFLSNKGWTKKEFDSIFTREIIEEEKLVLPVWFKVKKKDVYDYCPSLVNVLGVSWEDLGEEEVCRRLCKSILD